MNNLAEFRHFRYLLAIVEHKGIRDATEHLRTAEPNLSVHRHIVNRYIRIDEMIRAQAIQYSDLNYSPPWCG